MKFVDWPGIPEIALNSPLKTGSFTLKRILMPRQVSCLFLLAGYLSYLFPNAGSAQPPDIRFEQFTVDDGLPHNRVNDVQRDRNGFIWVATGGGVSRFDGFQFKNYLHTAADAKYWGVWGFISLTLDKTGRIWASSREHVFYFDHKKDVFVEFPISFFIRMDIDLIDNPGDDYVWLCNQNTIARIDPYTLDLDSVTTAKKRTKYAGFLPRKQQIWIGGQNGTDTIEIFDIKSRKWSFLPFPFPSTWGVFEDSNGRVWLGSEKLSCYDPSTRQWSQFAVANELGDELMYYRVVTDLCTDSTIWVMHIGHLRRFNTVLKKFINDYPIGGYLNSVCSDDAHILWAGDVTGLYCYDPTRPLPYFHHIFPEKYPRIGGSNGSLSELIRHRQHPDWVWAAPFGNGVVLYDQRRRRIVRHFLDPANGKTPPEFSNALGMLYNRDGRLWVFCQGGILVLDEWNGGYEIVTRHHHFHWMSRYANDRQGNIWIEANDGTFYQADPRGKTLSPLDIPLKTAHEAGLDYIQFDRHNNLWVFSQKELVRYNPATRQFKRLEIDWSLAPKKSQREANSFALDSAGTAWISTLAGVLHGDIDKGTFKLYDQRHGLAAGYAEKLVIDGRQNVWISTRNGVFRFDARSERFCKMRFRNIDTEHSMDLFSDAQQVYLMMHEGRYAAFDPFIFEPLPAPRPIFTGFRVQNKTFPFDRDSVAQFSVSLDFAQNNLGFDFTAVSLHEGKDLSFRYRLTGFDPEWVNIGNQRILTFTNLDPGKYTLEIQCGNAEQLWNPQSGVFQLNIRPPWYATWWFRSLLTLTFIALVYAIFRYRELQRLEQEKLRLRIARDLHDEMGSTLSSISILSEAALRNLQQDIDRARFGAIGERARQVMEAMSDIVWSVNPRNDSMANVLRRMKEFAVEILESQGIALHFEADEAVAALNLPMEQRKDFYLLFKEAVNNAAKYSDASGVWVTVRTENGGLTLEVHDNGRGFDVAQVKRGNGLWNMERRAERMGARFGLESVVGAGTLVSVSL